MSVDNLPTHVKEMRNFIAVSGQTEQTDIINKYAEEELSNTLKQAKLVVESLEDIGLDKLALLFNDRSHAELILENCITFKRRILDNNYRTAEMIAEAFSKIFEQIERERFDLIGLSEGHINVLTGNMQLLAESYNAPVIINESVVYEDLLTGLISLIESWESYRETDDAPEDFIEGVELGYLRAAGQLRELFQNYQHKIKTESINVKNTNNLRLVENIGDDNV